MNDLNNALFTQLIDARAGRPAPAAMATASPADYLKALEWLASAPVGFIKFIQEQPGMARGVVTSLKAVNVSPQTAGSLSKVPPAAWTEFLTKLSQDPKLVADIKSCPPEHKDETRERWIAVLRGCQYFVTGVLALTDGEIVAIEAVILTLMGLVGLTPALVPLLLVFAGVFVAGVFNTIVLGGIDLTLEIIVLALGGG